MSGAVRHAVASVDELEERLRSCFLIRVSRWGGLPEGLWTLGHWGLVPDPVGLLYTPSRPERVISDEIDKWI